MAKQFQKPQNQLVQSSEPGVIRMRYVSEGEFVTKDQLLFDIDPVDAKTQLDQAQKTIHLFSIKSLRLKQKWTTKFHNFQIVHLSWLQMLYQQN